MITLISVASISIMLFSFSPTPRITMNNLDIKVLIVDDHTLFRKGIRKLLESIEGTLIVGEAGDGRDAIKKVATLKPNVVLMDISMRDMNGLEATREIRNTFPETSVILLTMHDNEEHLKQGLEY